MKFYRYTFFKPPFDGKKLSCIDVASLVFFSLSFHCVASYLEGDRGSGRPGEKGTGGVREAGEEGAGSGIPKVAESGRKRGKLPNIAQYFAI